jgi:hypothetical protein
LTPPQPQPQRTESPTLVFGSPAEASQLVKKKSTTEQMAEQFQRRVRTRNSKKAKEIRESKKTANLAGRRGMKKKE